MIAFTVFGSIWLEFVLKVKVLRRYKQAIKAILPISLIFIVWDAYAIASGHWWFDKEQILGIFGPFGIPLEEYLFFTVVPLAAILTIEAVRTVKKHWQVYK
ncbi:MAG: lycopene cyclase domain-containing protein [Actinobacteria bacterium]|jgi:lycopene cyclase domain-containing protein|nr:lycopene cyclase domain-containing protein [Actinomycetota bacterium]